MRTTSSTLIAIVMVLTALGLVMLYSTSSVRAEASFADAGHFFKRQLMWLAVAAAVGAGVARFDYHRLQKPGWAWALAVLMVVTLVAVCIPGIGTKVGGSYRWLRLGPLSFQPSELAKLVVVVLLSAWMVRVRNTANRFVPGLLIPGVALAGVMLLVLAEPDFGTTILIASVGAAILFAGGAHAGWLSAFAFGGGAAILLLLRQSPVRWARIVSFWDPDKYPDKAYHLIQSKMAFVSGGAFGVGLGNSIQKQFYLPEAHTDFIFAIIGEELGLVFTLLVLLLFVGILVCGLTISARAPDPYGRLLGFGVTMLIVLQAAINMGVVIGCLPTKGLPLPFISYGGSSLIVSIACVALLLNIARHNTRNYVDRHARAIKDRIREV